MAAGSGRIGVPELRVGVPFPTAALEVVRFALAPQHVQAVVYGAATYEPEEARSIGLVDEVVPAETLQDLAWRRASALADVDAQVFAVTKRQLRAAALGRIERGAKEHDRLVAELWARPETIERVRGYVERTFRPRPS
jgi:enoyl-CoA hydratase